MAKNRLSDTKIAKMLTCFLETRSVAKVATKCSVTQTTVRRYRKLYKWDKITEKTTAAVVKRVEKESVKRSVRQANLGRKLQDAASNTIKILARSAGDEDVPIVPPSLIVKAAMAGVEIENEALGADKNKDVTITLKVPGCMVKELIGGSA